MLVWFFEDILIDELEIDCMVSKMKSDGMFVIIIKDLIGDYEVVWEQGD